jgi:hypothetical protein
MGAWAHEHHVIIMGAWAHEHHVIMGAWAHGYHVSMLATTRNGERDAPTPAL